MKSPAKSSVIRTVTRWSDGEPTSIDDRVVAEEPLEIRIGEQPLAITMRTPGHDRDLAAGFCLTEGIITHPDELVSVEPCLEADYGNIVVVTLTDDALQRRSNEIENATRENFVSSSCGLCGKQSIDRITQCSAPLNHTFTVSREVIQSLPDKLRAAQATFDETGGLHAAGCFTPAGELKILREDVGRHNAVDKLVGAALLSGQVPLHDRILLVSGRTSFEIMQKAAMAGVAVVAAVSAPSSLAVDFSKAMNMTLIGFLRPGRMNVYHDAKRLA